MKRALKQHKKVWPKRCKKRLPFIKTPRVDEILEIRVREILCFTFPSDNHQKEIGCLKPKTFLKNTKK